MPSQGQLIPNPPWRVTVNQSLLSDSIYTADTGGICLSDFLEGFGSTYGKGGVGVRGGY